LIIFNEVFLERENQSKLLFEKEKNLIKKKYKLDFISDKQRKNIKKEATAKKRTGFMEGALWIL